MVDKKGKTAPPKGDKKQEKKDKKEGSVAIKDNRPERILSSKQRPVLSHIDLSKEGKDFRGVVRICTTDIPGYLKIGDGVVMIYGISTRLGRIIEKKFAEKSGKDVKKIGYLTDDDVILLDKIIENLDKEIPEWLLNREKLDDGAESRNAHLIMADLKLAQRKEIQKLGKLKSFRGLRLQWGLPVRGQRTRSTFRKGVSVGVTKQKEKK
jgi:small subunit ribosomal protein S13